MQTIQSRSESESVDGGATAAPAARNLSNTHLQSLPVRPARWIPQRKAEILAAVRRGSISLCQACDLYDISVEEFMTWQRGAALHGLAGLRATTALKGRNVAFADYGSKDALPSAPNPASRENR
jgi:Protein of unknown function (DUF1153)